MPRRPKKRWFGPDWGLGVGGGEDNAGKKVCKEKGEGRRGVDAGVNVSQCRITYSISSSDDGDEDEG